jgi:tRNA (cmo5U34)-methyltransferase
LFGLHGDLNTAAAQNALEAWLEFVVLQGLPQATQDNVRHRATVEDSLVSEARIQELLEEAGFVNIERIYQVQLLGGWRAQKLG